MPHVIVKLATGRSEQTQSRIAAAVTEAVMATANCEAAAVSVAIEDVEPVDRVEKVYKPEIAGKARDLYKKPGYNPL